MDSHQHTHVLPFVNGLVLKLCNEYNIRRIRIPKEGYTFSGGFSAGLGRKVGRAGLSFCADMAAMAAEGKGMYEIRVKDNGIGMSQEFAAKIFEPFLRYACRRQS